MRPPTKSAPLSRRRPPKYWSEWVRFLGIPFEWQEAVIRAAITLKLNAYDDTGAIVAAMTTSIPEAAGSERNWDYRYCWVRDGYFVVNALNRLGATRTMERYLGYIVNVAANAGDSPLQPVYGIDGRAALDERRSRLTGRLSRHGPGAHRQPGLPPGAARCLWLGHPCGDAHLLRPAADPAWRRSPVPSPRSARRAGPALLRPARCRPCGSCAAARGCIPFRP
jgi:hypothetical protein